MVSFYSYSHLKALYCKEITQKYKENPNQTTKQAVGDVGRKNSLFTGRNLQNRHCGRKPEKGE